MKKHKIYAGMRCVWTMFTRVTLKIFRKVRMPFVICMILFAIVFSLFRALTPWVKQYKTDVEHHLSTLLGQPVTISDLETSWYWFQPVLKMTHVTIIDPQERLLNFLEKIFNEHFF